MSNKQAVLFILALKLTEKSSSEVFLKLQIKNICGDYPGDSLSLPRLFSWFYYSSNQNNVPDPADLRAQR